MITVPSSQDPQPVYDVLIVGGGAAGYAAAIYAARYNLRVLLIQELFGGWTALGGVIENYPGFSHVDGYDLMIQFKEQAERLGVDIIEGLAELESQERHCIQLRVEKKMYAGKTVILTVGTERRKLGLPRDEELLGKGLHYCITCDGPLYKGKTVGIVGGGDAAVKGANEISPLVQKIYLIVREKDLSRAEPINLERMKKKSNITVLFETSVVDYIANEKITGVKLSRPFEGRDELDLDGLFVEIGAVPNSKLPHALGVELDPQGYIRVQGDFMQTTVDGIFAAGDITNANGGFKQIVTAAADGALAATGAFHDLDEHADIAICQIHHRPVAKEIQEERRASSA
jgi:thioredoxin reductase (NADPH)